jgi:hypothetical protein
MQEEWLSVVGWEGFYSVSTFGHIRSEARCIIDTNGVQRRYSGIIRALTPDTDGYLQLQVTKPGMRSTLKVHQQVLKAFTGPPPPGHEACHNDGNHQHNYHFNLRWDTPINNQRDKLQHGTHHQANKIACSLNHLLCGANLRVRADNGYRGCNACDRAHATVGKLRRKGLPFNFRTIADLKYFKIMCGVEQ